MVNATQLKTEVNDSFNYILEVCKWRQTIKATEKFKTIIMEKHL